MFDRFSRPDRPDPAAPRVRLETLVAEARAKPRVDDGPTVVYATSEGCADPPDRFRWMRRRVGSTVRRWLPESPEPRRRHAVFVSVAALAALVVLVGVWWQRPAAERPPDLPVAVAAVTASSSASDLLVVNVVGEVPTPGLVTVSSGARVADAVLAAGGVNPGARPQGLNLARKVADGEQIAVGVPVADQPADPVGPPEKVDLNSASKEQLDQLPGVGPVTAQRIVERRARKGPFTSVDQLREVEGIGDTRLAKLAELVRV